MKIYIAMLSIAFFASLVFEPVTAQEFQTVAIKRVAVTGVGIEEGVCRRDPSDVIKVGDLYYVWYSKGPIKSGYNATVWYATSTDGINWTEKGQAIGKGEEGAWDFGSVFTPGILVAQDQYWLFFTGTSHPYQQGKPDSKIGLAVADSPNGPWKKLDHNPVLRNSENKEDFDSLLIDDSCAMIRNDKIFLYYKGRQFDRSPHETKMGLAIADSPAGPYVKHESNPVTKGNHAILNWPQGKGVAAMIGVTGPEELTNSVQLSEDGINFTKTHNVVDGPRAAGSYRPDAFTDSNDAQPISWGLEIGKHKDGQLPYLERVEIQWPEAVSPKNVALGKATMSRTNLTGIGAEKGVMRRDPSDIIKVGDLFYVWYSKGPKSSGYDATVWYATSPDGVNWTEKGMAIAKNTEAGSWDQASVFTPNILVAVDKYWLFFTGISKNQKIKPNSKIGLAVSDSPDGPWQRMPNNPVLANSKEKSEFDSHLIDDSCLIVRDGKYWLYYKGRQLGKSPRETQMGLAIADQPQGPYKKHVSNPVIPGNHEVLVWPQSEGVCAMIGHVGPKNITNSVLYSEDGLNFSKTHETQHGPWAGGTFRPEAFTDSKQGVAPSWGVEIGKPTGGKGAGKLPFIRRFDIEWSK